jgi:hypothetical protein
MTIPRRRFLHLAAGAIALPAVSRVAWAQQRYPSRPVRIVVGLPAGGAVDLTARLISQWLLERLAQPFIIENRSGFNSNIATEAVVTAPQDGHTLLIAGSWNASNATFYDNKLNFNFIRDIAPVAGMIRSPFAMVVNPSFPAKTVPEFITYAKANPGKLNIAMPGGVNDISGELFKIMAGVDMTNVPYRGGAPALTDLLGGQVNAPHCFPINAHDMRDFAMPASRNLDRGSAWEAVGAGSGTRQRSFLALRRAGPRQSYARGKIGALSGEGHRFPRPVYPVEVNVLGNWGLQTTNLGVRSSNLFWRAK